MCLVCAVVVDQPGGAEKKSLGARPKLDYSVANCSVE
jgi:hypothetical protein